MIEIDAKTKVCCLIGKPVEHSLSPAIHNATFEKFKLNYVYVAFNVDNIEFAIHGLRALNIAGASVTIPYKSEIIHFLDRVDALSEKIGAINTIVNEQGRLIGYNTDSSAAISSLEKKIRVHNKKMIIFGAGGAGRAIAFGAKEAGAHVAVVDIDPSKAEQLAQDVGCEAIANSDIVKFLPDVLVNATPIGMFPKTDSMPFDKKLLKKEMVVLDIVYNPLKTKLLKEAEKLGCKTVQGIDMFALQASKQFELFTGTKAPIEYMKELAMTELKKAEKKK